MQMFHKSSKSPNYESIPLKRQLRLFDLRRWGRLLLDGGIFRPTTRDGFLELCHYMIHMKRQRHMHKMHQTAW
ncbi:MAG: hypothetical protein EBT60_07230 [Bacteroidetes bacterium]|nr:hypothetical protein [Bacteroidota bacterium]